jgi:arginine exporter protein ArgO
MAPLQLGAAVVGVVFLLLGVLGFVPGITSSYGELTVIGHESGAHLLGIFQVNVVHNVVHLALGVVGVLTARTEAAAKYFLVIAGVIYLLLWIFGLAIDLESPLNFPALNTADNWLHLVLGVAMIVLGFALPSTRASRR